MPAATSSSMLETEAPSHHDFFAFLHGSHRHLEQAGIRLVEAVNADAPDDTIDLWRDLESELLAHIEAEERYVLPAFARVDHDEAMALLRQHGRIREQLLELGIAVELHRLRMYMLDEFTATLRGHAEREERMMYTWAASLLDDKLSGPVRRHVDRVTR